MRLFPRAIAVVAVLPLLALAPAGCSSAPAPSKPTGGTYTINFPTIGAAIASESVTVSVYDSAAGCVTLLEAVQSSTLGNLGAPLQTITTSTCALDNPDAGAVALPYGTYAVLVVAAEAQGETPFLDGCTIATVSEASPAVVVVLDVTSDAVTVPATPAGCSGLEAYCATIGVAGAPCQRQADDAG